MWEPCRLQGQGMRGRKRCSRCQKKNSWQLLEKTVVLQIVPLQTMEAHSGVDIHLQPLKDSMQGYAWRRLCRKLMLDHVPGRSCSLWRRVHTGAGLLTEDVAGGTSVLEQSSSEGLYSVERIHTGAVLKERHSVVRISHAEAHEQCKEERVTEIKYHGLISIPHLAAPLREEVKGLGMEEWSWAWEEAGVGEKWIERGRGFSFVFVYHYSTLF